jgi:hypothetical protein
MNGRLSEARVESTRMRTARPVSPLLRAEHLRFRDGVSIAERNRSHRYRGPDVTKTDGERGLPGERLESRTRIDG